MQPIETRYDGCRFRSRTEARWAVFFNMLNLRYEYEMEGYRLESGWYLPDFWLPQIGWWVEIKGKHPTAKEVNLCFQLAKETQNSVMLCIGSPIAKPQVCVFPAPGEVIDVGEFDIGPTYYWAEDRRNEGEYWLTSDGGCAFSIGPVHGPSHGKWPICDYGLIAVAYEAARSARFERR